MPGYIHVINSTFAVKLKALYWYCIGFHVICKITWPLGDTKNLFSCLNVFSLIKYFQHTSTGTFLFWI